MDPILIVVTIVTLFLSGFVQGLAGFGSALVAVPLLSLYLGPKVVVPFVLVHGLLMNMYLSVRNRESIQSNRVLPIFIFGIIGIPVGAFVLLILPSSLMKILIGGIIMVFSLVLLSGRSFRLRNERKAHFPVGFLSGLLNGSVSMSGPPVILFLSNQGVSKKHFRANLVTYFFLLNIVTFIIFLATGIMNDEVLLMSILFIPPLPVGILAGEAISSKLEEGTFRKVALLLVTIAGLAAMTTGAFALF